MNLSINQRVITSSRAVMLTPLMQLKFKSSKSTSAAKQDEE